MNAVTSIDSLTPIGNRGEVFLVLITRYDVTAEFLRPELWGLAAAASPRGSRRLDV